VRKPQYFDIPDDESTEEPTWPGKPDDEQLRRAVNEALDELELPSDMEDTQPFARVALD
jgi:hypothetical protein